MREVVLPDFPDYRIREDGGVFNIKHDRLCTQTVDSSNNYKVVRIKNKNGRFVKQYLHRLMALAFVPRAEGKNHVDHINGIRTDNRIDNLRWCTPKENNSFPLAKQHKKEWMMSPEGQEALARKGMKRRKPIVDETCHLIFSGGIEACRVVGLSVKSSCWSGCAQGHPARGHMLALYDPEKHKGYEQYDPDKHASLFFKDVEGKARPLLCVTDNKLFMRAKDAALYYKTSLNNIARCARGERHKTVGRTFRYVTWEEFNSLKATIEVIE